MPTIPTEPFYAVTYEVQDTIPGDERSRTHPGHGYPEHTVTTQLLEVFADAQQLKNWVVKEQKKSYGRVPYTAMLCTPLTVEVETTVTIKSTVDD